MDLRLLRYFVACAQHRSMHAAAEALHVSQPALSKAVHQLETELGVELLERRPRGVVTTPYGETLLRYAKMIDAEIRRMTAEIDSMRGATKGKINVGSVPTMIAVMNQAAGSVLQSHPGLKLEIKAAFSSELTTALLDGELDLALILISEGASPPGLTFDPILRTNPVLVAREGHPLTTEPNLSLEALASFPWLVASFPATHWRTISRVFLDAGIPPPEAAMEVSTVVFFASLVSQSDMLAVMPQSILGSPQGAGLVTLPMTFPFPPEVIALAYRENARLLPGAKVVVQRIKDICSELS